MHKYKKGMLKTCLDLLCEDGSSDGTVHSVTDGAHAD